MSYNNVSVLMENNPSPLDIHKLGRLRNLETPISEVREILTYFTSLLLNSVKSFTLVPNMVGTRMGLQKVQELQQLQLCFVVILRAAVFMMRGALKVFPDALVDFIGLSRDHETLLPNEYLPMKGVPNQDKKKFFILDGMVATGGSALFTVSKLIEMGIKVEDIQLVCIITCPEGIKAIHDVYPELMIYTVIVDQGLNEKGYIIPGLGDLGGTVTGTEK